jgi:hypothetical protein
MPAAAGEGTLEITAGPGTPGHCLDAASLQATVAGRLGYDPLVGEAAPRVTVEVKPDGDGLVALVSIVAPDGHKLGQRQLRAASCGDLAESLGLVLRMALDRDALPPAEPPPPVTLAAKETAPATPLVFWAGLGAAAAFGATPTFAIATRLSLEGRWHALDLGLEANLVLPTGRASAAGGSYEEQQLVGSIVPCYRWGVFGGCAVFTAGAARLQGFDYPNAQASVKPYVALGVRGQGDLSLAERWTLRFEAGLLAPVVKPSIDVGSTVIWTQPSVSGELGVTLILRLE